jgi:hypothetical protein
MEIKRNQQVLRQSSQSSDLGRKNELTLNLAGLKEGEYTVQIAFRDPDGKIIAEANEKLSIIQDPFDW